MWYLEPPTVPLRPQDVLTRVQPIEMMLHLPLGPSKTPSVSRPSPLPLTETRGHKNHNQYHLHDLQFYRPSYLHHHRRSIRPIFFVIFATLDPSIGATSVATSTLVTRETMGFIPTQHDPFPFTFPFPFPTIRDHK